MAEVVTEGFVPPVLSSDVNTDYEFKKVEQNLSDRKYLGPYNESSLKDKIRDYYSLDKLVEFLKLKTKDGDHRYKAITLQFPDSLISDSAIIVQYLQNRLNTEDGHHRRSDLEIDFNKPQKDCTDDIEIVHKKCTDKVNGECTCDKPKHDHEHQKIWILADTSYSPCCIDEVAAEHVNADLVVHFGDACLKNVEKLPAVYVLGKPFLNQNEVVEKFKQIYQDKDENICLMADAPFSSHLKGLFERLSLEYQNLVYSDVINNSNYTIIDHIDDAGEGINYSNRVIYGQSELDEAHLQDYKLFHLNLPDSPRLLELSTKFSEITIFDTDTNEIVDGPFPSLMKRYRFMHIARTAGTIGILVNTLSLLNTKLMLNTVIKWIKDSGKKHYTFVVGKPNVAKLANFENIDIWCILGCGQSGIIIDGVGEYYKPIITPYELQMALSDELSWTGNWIVDFKQVLDLNEDDGNDLNKESENVKEDVDDDAPEFDVVTGRYVSTSRPLRRYIQHLEIEEDEKNEDEKSLVKKFSSQVAIKGTVSTSAIALQGREWKGLGSDFQQDEEIDEEGALVEEGRGGVARGYDFDRENV